jgi:hypothetical protein
MLARDQCPLCFGSEQLAGDANGPKLLRTFSIVQLLRHMVTAIRDAQAGI